MGSGTVEIAQYSGTIGGSGDSVFTLASPVNSGTANYSLVDTGSYIDLTYSTTSATAGSLYGRARATAGGTRPVPRLERGEPAVRLLTRTACSALRQPRQCAGTTVNVDAANVNPASVTFSSSGAVSYTVTGSYDIAGIASITVNGGGLVTFSNSNSYTGPTTITAGTLAIGGAGLLGGGNYAGAVNNVGWLNYNSSANQTFSGQISGGGTLAQNGPVAVTLSSSNTYTGPTVINGGLLNVGAGREPRRRRAAGHGR